MLDELSDPAEREVYNAAERNERKQHTKEKVHYILNFKRVASSNQLFSLRVYTFVVDS